MLQEVVNVSIPKMSTPKEEFSHGMSRFTLTWSQKTHVHGATLFRVTMSAKGRQKPKTLGKFSSGQRHVIDDCTGFVLIQQVEHGGQGSRSASGQDSRTDGQQWREGCAQGSRGQSRLSHDG